MKKKDGKKKGFLHENHPKPQTRRDFLAAGLMDSVGFLMMPTVLGIMAKHRLALAAEDCAAAASTMTPCMIFDFAGGMAIAQDTAAFGPGGMGDFLSDAAYAKLGYPAAQAASKANQLDPAPVGGIPWHVAGGLGRGLKQVMGTDAQAKTSGALIAAVSGDDTSNGPHNFCHLVARAGLVGSLVPIVGTNNSQAGGNSLATENVPTTKPVVITSPAQALTLVQYGRLETALASRDRVKKVLTAIQSMSSDALARFNSEELPAQAKKIVECGYVKASELASAGAGGLDPRLDARVTAVFNMADAEEARVATLAYLVLSGYAGTAVFSRGGADYHDSTRVNGDNYNVRAGVLMGKTLELAARMGKPIFVYGFTDGSVRAGTAADANAGGRFVWTSDGGEYGGTFFLAYDPAGKRPMRTHQLGAYNKTGGGVVREQTVFSASATNAGYAGFLNYLAFNGKQADFSKYVRTNIFGSNLTPNIAFRV